MISKTITKNFDEAINFLMENCNSKDEFQVEEFNKLNEDDIDKSSFLVINKDRKFAFKFVMGQMIIKVVDKIFGDNEDVAYIAISGIDSGKMNMAEIINIINSF